MCGVCGVIQAWDVITSNSFLPTWLPFVNESLELVSSKIK